MAEKGAALVAALADSVAIAAGVIRAEAARAPVMRAFFIVKRRSFREVGGRCHALPADGHRTRIQKTVNYEPSGGMRIPIENGANRTLDRASREDQEHASSVETHGGIRDPDCQEILMTHWG
ncbi:hypothetical protein GCM10009530_55730 [Microbispora corallina]|uniref:Uncharacterized protein n=1 Tax=Microbispora corallina TaxID=83302 RepID=A0ABQ4G6Z9_9ACTN|nr:hypothetical protein Mco01_58240 [Microbispora corallina]